MTRPSCWPTPQQAAGVDSYVMVSAMAADPQATADDEVFQAYLRAKGVADEAIRSRAALNWTIVRPGVSPTMTGTGRVATAESTGRGAFPAQTSRRCSSRCSTNRAPQAEAST